MKQLSWEYLNSLYQSASLAQLDDNLEKVDKAETYGEILYPSIEKLLSQVTLTAEDVFVDLGSGLGKVISQVFLNSPVKEAWGIEFLPSLHQQASAVAEKIRNDLPEFFRGERKLHFSLGDFLKIPLDKATVVIICAICFTQQSLHALGEIINRTPSIHTVLSLRPLNSLVRLKFKKVIRVECSWDTALCYLYSC